MLGENEIWYNPDTGGTRIIQFNPCGCHPADAMVTQPSRWSTNNHCRMESWTMHFKTPDEGRRWLRRHWWRKVGVM